MISRRRLCTACLLLAAAPLLSAQPTMNPPRVFSEQALVTSKEGKVVLKILFHNRTLSTVWIPAVLAEDEEPEGRLFDIRTADDDRPVPYVGKMVKRGPPTLDDWRTQAPESRHVNAIDLTRSYDFLPGTHRYVLRWEAHYLVDPLRPAEPESAGEVRVEFTHTR